MKKAEGEALQRQIATLEHQVRHLTSALADQKRWAVSTAAWNRKARVLLGLWMKSVYYHPSRPPVGSTRSWLKEW